MEKNLNVTPFMNVNQFKEEIKRGYDESVDKESIKNSVSSFTSRVRAIVRGWGDLVRKKKYK